VRTSASIAALAEALSKAQSEYEDLKKSKTAKVKTKDGGEYSYSYSDLADVLRVLRKPFAAHGLALVQGCNNASRDQSVTITTRILHASGEWIEDDLILPVADPKPQTLGSAITYGRRYHAGSMAGLASEEDEDGQIAQNASNEQGKGKGKQQQQTQQQPPQQARQGRPAPQEPAMTSRIDPSNVAMAKSIEARLAKVHGIDVEKADLTGLWKGMAGKEFTQQVIDSTVKLWIDNPNFAAEAKKA
jgi:hypothetical protein